jgi:peptidoglycan-associated lipoprotein
MLATHQRPRHIQNAQQQSKHSLKGNHMPTDHSSSWKRLLLQSALLATVAVAGCHKKTSSLPPADTMAPTQVAAPTASISADPLAIEIGQSVVLNWRTTNATSVTIDGIGPVPVNGTQTVSPSNSTNFHLVAKGDGGVTEASVRVTVNVAVAPTIPSDTSNDGPMGSEAAFHQNVQDIFFGYDSSELDAAGQSSSRTAASYLTSHPAIKLLIGGYCDDRGSAEYNITLGEDRANAAKAALVQAGVAPGRIRVVSYGKERQFCTEENDTCWQQNRRAQFSMDR